MRLNLVLTLGILPFACLCTASAASYLDIAPSGQLTTWKSDASERLTDTRAAAGSSNLGIEWDEERDVQEIRVHYQNGLPKGAAVEYWFKYWPYDPPKMPTIEDPMDDPWQGKWLKAESPAILMVRLTARNPAASARQAHVWLSVDNAGNLSLNRKSMRGGKPVAELGEFADANVRMETRGVHVGFSAPAQGERSIVIKLPCVSDLSSFDLVDLDRLSYSLERERMIAYPQGVMNPAIWFTVPEPKFNQLRTTPMGRTGCAKRESLTDC